MDPFGRAGFDGSRSCVRRLTIPAHGPRFAAGLAAVQAHTAGYAASLHGGRVVRGVVALLGDGGGRGPADARTGCSMRGRVGRTRLPAGLSLTSCLPGLCFTSCLPGAAALTAPTASLSRHACQTGRYAQPSPPDARIPANVAPLVRSEKNPPLTHGDPAEAGPPGQSQPSRVHPVKHRAGAMRTRTGAHTSSTSCASPVASICEHLRTGRGGGRHPKTCPTSPPPCGIAREKPPKWRSATPGRIPPLRPPSGLLSRLPVHRHLGA
jgi:hypothetical protein